MRLLPLLPLLLSISPFASAATLDRDPLACTCSEKPHVLPQGSLTCNPSQYCARRCLNYLRYEERIMDLVDCPSSVCVINDEKAEGEVARKIGKCDCHCRNARQVGNLGGKTEP